jgi:peptidoglycan/LPS O-acetylase OafA/YrhL
MRKAIFMVVLAIAVIATFAYWLIFKSDSVDIQEILMIGALVLVVGFALFLAFRRFRDARENFPAEDEMSKNIMRRGAATSYYLSLYLWLVIMYFEDSIELERSSLIGAGIMGMAIIWALSWIYHRYIRRSHD